MKVEIKEVKISEIKLNPDNPRRISKQDMDRLVKSLNEFPDMLNIREIVVDETMTILGGNMRYLALKKSGAKAATAKIVTGLTKEQKREFVIKDNSNFGEYDFDALANGWSDLPLADWGVDLPEDWLGGDKTEPADAEPQIDRAEELNKTWGVKLGDLWQIGEHRLLCGDSTKKEDVGRVMGGEGAVFCFTSPPYSDQRDYKGNIDLSPQHLANFLNAPCDLFAVNLGMSRKDNEINQYWDEYISFAKSIGLKFLSWNVWDKGEAGAIGAQTAMFAIFHEWILVFGEKKKLNRTVKCKSAGEKEHGTRREKDGTLTKNPNRKTIGDYKQMSTVASISAQKARNLEVDHPAMYPIALPQEYINACTNPGDIIFEPFTGSGTNLVACQNLNRKCRGIEISPAYCAVILQRMTDAFPGIEIKKVK